MQDASLTKERIISLLSQKGPSLPVHVARAINLSPLFASAFLSELYREGKIQISNMKVGSSPLYYLPDHKPQLENFIEHLNAKERDAFNILKQSKVLKDEEQQPVIRVALRAIKDFAIPVQSNDLIIWKYYLLPDSEISSYLNNSLKPLPVQQAPQPQLTAPVQLSQVAPLQEAAQSSISQPIISATAPTEKIKENITYIEKEIHERKDDFPRISKEKKKKASSSDTKFLEEIKEYLSSKDIELLSILSDKKKDFAAKVRIDAPFGKQELYLVFRDKKKLTEDDLTIILHRAQMEKMPALILAPGEIDKKATDYHSTWKNLIKFERVKL